MSLIKRLLAVGTAAAISLLGFVPAAPAQALPTVASTPIASAATWLAGHPATEDDGYSYQIANATGLAVARTKATTTTLRSRIAQLRTGAAANVPGQPGNAANLTILAQAMHLNPRSFGGVNLVNELSKTIGADGKVGPYGSAFGQALAIIAFKRTAQPVPAAVVTRLLTFQDASGAFGYEYNGFVADPDSTALAIQALNLIGGHQSEVTKALDWATTTQKSEGYWESWSPVDSTALMASAFATTNKATLATLDTSYTKAYTWLRSQQLSDGGFPASLGDTHSNLLSTSNATYLLTGKSLSTFSYPLWKFVSAPKPKIIGKAKVGRTLVAKTATAKPSAVVTYQWLRAGKKIAGATHKTYKVRSADAGRYLRVRVTYTQIAYNTVVKVSAGVKAHR